MTLYQTRKCETCGAFFNVAMPNERGNRDQPVIRSSGPWECEACRSQPAAALLEPTGFGGVLVPGTKKHFKLRKAS